MRLAIIANAATPYRVHLHRRIVREIPEIELWSAFTHEFSNAPWTITCSDAIRPVYFGPGEGSERQGVLNRPLAEWHKGGRIIDWITRSQIEAVVLFGYNDLGRLRLIAWCKRHRVACYLFGDSNILNDGPKGWIGASKRILLPTILAQCTGVFHCGRLGAQYFKRYGVHSARLFPFPYEPDYESIATAEADSPAAGGIDPIAVRRKIIYSGRLAQEKRVDLLIEAFAKIALARQNWDLVIAGDGPLRATLEGQVPPELLSRVRFVGFVAESAALARLYAACDVLVLPSDREPWGVVVTEAATRLALVCSSAVGAAADLLVDHENGRLFQSGSKNSLVDALLEVTSESNTDRMKAASARILSKWRSESDPVETLRKLFVRRYSTVAA